MMNFLLILLLTLFPLLAFPTDNIENKEDFNDIYYPKLDSDSAYELHVIKRNYYRYGDKLKILADKKIKEMQEIILNANKVDDK